jgi:hypothetical protein
VIHEGEGCCGGEEGTGEFAERMEKGIISDGDEDIDELEWMGW